MAQIDVCNSPREPNLRFLKNICSLVKWPLPYPLTVGLGVEQREEVAS